MRVWCVLHTDYGPFLLCAWYRPPSDEQLSIESCEKEHERLSRDVMGTLLVGDLNVHHAGWLRHSNGTSAAGRRMCLAAAQMGLHQIDRSPTRDVVEEAGMTSCAHLLDLALTDIAGVTAQVLPKIADHKLVEVVLPLPVPESAVVRRLVWDFKKADWERLEADLYQTDWSCVCSSNTDAGAAALSSKVLVEKTNSAYERNGSMRRSPATRGLTTASLLQLLPNETLKELLKKRQRQRYVAKLSCTNGSNGQRMSTMSCRPCNVAARRGGPGSGNFSRKNKSAAAYRL